MENTETKPAKPATYLLRLTPRPGNWLVPPEARLRAALKVLLRRYGLRCTCCQPVTPTEADQ